jgi:hypothetical protein
VLGQQVGDGTIRRVFLPRLNDQWLCRDQILELLWSAWSKFGDRLADFGWIKCVHKLESFEFEPGNFLTPMRTIRCGDSLNRIETITQRKQLSLLKALPSHQRSLIADGQPVVLEIVITEKKDLSKGIKKSQE